MCTSGYLEGPCPDKESDPANILKWVHALSHRPVLLEQRVGRSERKKNYYVRILDLNLRKQENLDLFQ